ncbi:MAG: DMT family transporter [Clostridia bacterium]|nr:DMT family transporter [Clostridia bacterium]
MNHGNTQLKADMMLVLVTLCWGVSYFMMDLCLEEMDPLTLNAYRFLGAFAVAALIAFKRIKNVNKTTLKYALLISLSLIFVYVGATYGVKYTSQSNAGFFCATSTVFTPIMAFFVKKVIPDKKLALVIVLCTVGVALMSLNGQFKMASGDLLCLMCGFAYSIDLLITETAVAHEEVDAFQIGVYQLGFTGVWMLILSFIFEDPCLPQTPGCWVSVVFLSIFCTGVAFVVQAIAQQYTTATHVGIIFALEPVFAGVVAFLFAGERLLARAYVGAFLMLMSIIIMEVDVKSLFKGKKEEI